MNMKERKSMRRVFFTMILILMSAAAYSQVKRDSIIIDNVTGGRDTTVFHNPDEVSIITTDSTQIVKVIRRMGGCMLGKIDTNEVYEKTTRINDASLSTSSKFYYAPIITEQDTSSLKGSIHFAAGVTAPTNVPDNMSFDPWNSFELMLTGLVDYTPKNSLQTFSAGLGFTWHNFVLKTNKMFTQKEYGYIDLTDFPDGAERRWSNIHYWSLSVPLLFTQRFDRRGLFKLTVGAIVNFNKSGYIKNTYELNQLEYDVRTNKIENRPVTFDLMGIMKICGIGLYCRYSPFSVLKDDYGPQFHSLSFGLYF